MIKNLIFLLLLNIAYSDDIKDRWFLDQSQETELTIIKEINRNKNARNIFDKINLLLIYGSEPTLEFVLKNKNFIKSEFDKVTSVTRSKSYGENTVFFDNADKSDSFFEEMLNETINKRILFKKRTKQIISNDDNRYIYSDPLLRKTLILNNVNNKLLKNISGELNPIPVSYPFSHYTLDNVQVQKPSTLISFCPYLTIYGINNEVMMRIDFSFYFNYGFNNIFDKPDNSQYLMYVTLFGKSNISYTFVTSEEVKSALMSVSAIPLDYEDLSFHLSNTESGDVLIRMKDNELFFPWKIISLINKSGINKKEKSSKDFFK